ncbi:MAG: class I SAM-dependent rRNA methyltransferase [Bacteroidetes bacterium]|nr:class I SAM-dependent rRNA methyltransferase [Bacteroidota bacterium]
MPLDSPHAIVTLKPKRDQSIRRRHPWVFSGGIKHIQGQPEAGDWVEVHANKGAILGWGQFAPGASIAVRMLSFSEIQPDDAWWFGMIQQAVQVRMDLGLIDQDGQNCCRLVHAEGDGLPGLIADFYNGVLVIQCHTPGMHRHVNILVDAFREALGNRLVGVYDKSAKTLAKNGGSPTNDGWIWGESPKNHVAWEHGHQFVIDWEQGQKTGFFLDQRENRALVGSLSRGKKVLNVFSYTGGFSIYALQGGATEVHSLDASARALEVGEDNVKLNGFDSRTHRSIQADALEYLKTEAMRDYDIVILDPPAFAKRASARHAAVQGYKRINLRALETMKPGSLLFTFSCSQAVDDALFSHTLVAAAIQAGRTVRILHRLHQPPDHPVNVYHPEGSYLKGLVLRVDGEPVDTPSKEVDGSADDITSMDSED